MKKNSPVALFLVVVISLAFQIDVKARQLVLTGKTAKENVQKVNSKINWHTNLNSALAEAHRKGKMVLWVHMIGKIDGAT